MESVIKAADFAAIKHKDQRRKNKSAVPYINHPIGVAKILTSEGKVTDPIVLQAALLHDTVEDTDTTIEEIRDAFGDKVQSIVAEVTDDKSLLKQTRKQLQIENVRGLESHLNSHGNDGIFILDFSSILSRHYVIVRIEGHGL